MDRAQQDFEDAGVGLTLIGQATPRHADHFRRKRNISLTVLADRKRESYRAAGAKVATVGELLGPESVARGVGHALRSAGKTRQGRVIGHPAQLGGALLIEPDGTVAWSHMSDNAADNASPEEILEAASGLRTG